MTVVTPAVTAAVTPSVTPPMTTVTPSRRQLVPVLLTVTAFGLALVSASQ